MSQWPDNVFDDRLKPCPFCGSKHVVIEGPDFHDDGTFSVACDEDETCMARLDDFGTVEQAIEAWNRRNP